MFFFLYCYYCSDGGGGSAFDFSVSNIARPSIVNVGLTKQLRIEGIVYIDTNGDGINNEGGVVGVNVEIVPKSGGAVVSSQVNLFSFFFSVF